MNDTAKNDAKADATPTTLFVIDTTAKPEFGPRTHELIIDGQRKPFTFQPGKPNKLPYAIATKFLRHDEFVLTDADGTPLEYRKPPRQPDELGAGERFKIADNETVARLEELTLKALLQRVLPMPGGEQFEPKGDKVDQPALRASIIAFLIEHKVATRKANLSRERDVGSDDFTPEAELDDAA